MKNIIKVLALAIAMVTISTSTYAQKNERQRMTREQLAETQARFIANEMAMDDSTATRFVETFCQFQKDVWAPSLKETPPIFRIKRLNRQ